MVRGRNGRRQGRCNGSQGEIAEMAGARGAEEGARVYPGCTAARWPG